MTAIPRPPKRVKDPALMRRLHLNPGPCRACGERGESLHHLVGRGQGGPDAEANLIWLCRCCHSALHGNPFTDALGRRWTAADVRRAVGLTLTPSEWALLSERLTAPRAADYLERAYHVRVSLDPFATVPL